MAIKTIQELKDQATVIRNEVNEGVNTATRVGQMHLDTVETLNDKDTKLDTRVTAAKQTADSAVNGLNAHTGNGAIHLIPIERDKWNNHVADGSIHILQADQDNWNSHVGSSLIHVTQQDKDNWNAHNGKQYVVNEWGQEGMCLSIEIEGYGESLLVMRERYPYTYFGISRYIDGYAGRGFEGIVIEESYVHVSGERVGLGTDSNDNAVIRIYGDKAYYNKDYNVIEIATVDQIPTDYVVNGENPGDVNISLQDGRAIFMLGRGGVSTLGVMDSSDFFTGMIALERSCQLAGDYLGLHNDPSRDAVVYISDYKAYYKNKEIATKDLIPTDYVRNGQNPELVEIKSGDIDSLYLTGGYGARLSAKENLSVVCEIGDINLNAGEFGKAYYNSKEIATVDLIPTDFIKNGTNPGEVGIHAENQMHISAKQYLTINVEDEYTTTHISSNSGYFNMSCYDNDFSEYSHVRIDPGEISLFCQYFHVNGYEYVDFGGKVVSFSAESYRIYLTEKRMPDIANLVVQNEDGNVFFVSKQELKDWILS